MAVLWTEDERESALLVCSSISKLAVSKSHGLCISLYALKGSLSCLGIIVELILGFSK